jgi:hypothetical protein
VVVDDQAGDLRFTVVGGFGHGPRIVFPRSDREGELLGLAWRFCRLGAAIGDA